MHLETTALKNHTLSNMYKNLQRSGEINGEVASRPSTNSSLPMPGSYEGQNTAIIHSPHPEHPLQLYDCKEDIPNRSTLFQYAAFLGQHDESGYANDFNYNAVNSTPCADNPFSSTYKSTEHQYPHQGPQTSGFKSDQSEALKAPTAEFTEFPHATAFLEKMNADSPRLMPMQKLPLYDYNFANDITLGKPLSFTAVELITFLPHLCRSNWIANRLLNGGMQNTTHFEIHSTHRLTNSHQDGITVSTIANGYLDAMRGPGWRVRPKEQKGTWTRKGHKPPKNWVCSLEVAGFQPDRVLYGYGRIPDPVPFSDLLHGVRKMPTGFDAADLTHAIEFAIGNPLEDGQVWMFPTHLSFILDRIGRTHASHKHQDSEIATRYEQQFRNKKRSVNRIRKLEHVGYTTPNPESHVQIYHAPPQSQATLHITQQLVQSSPWQAQTQPLETYPIVSQFMVQERPHLNRQWSQVYDVDVNESAMDLTTPYKYDPNLWDPSIPMANTVVAEMTAMAGECESFLDEPTPSHMMADVPLEMINDWNQQQLDTSTSDLSERLDCDQSDDLDYLDVLPEELMDGHDPADLLRECVEGNDMSNVSVLADAARVARLPENINEDWCVRHMLVLLDSAWSNKVLEGDFGEQ
jgi:hypothetical protein